MNNNGAKTTVFCFVECLVASTILYVFIKNVTHPERYTTACQYQFMYNFETTSQFTVLRWKA